MKIRKDDQVEIITGKDRGKRGKVLRTVTKSGKVVVEGLNLVKKHSRPRKSGEKGQRVEIPSPINASNVMVVCPGCGKPARIGFTVQGDVKSRVCRKCEKEF